MTNEDLEKEKYNIAEFKEEEFGCVYRPPQNSEPIAQNATVGVKFSNDIFLMKSFLDQQKIEYKEEELEDSPMGKGFRIKRDK
jgi:hypothetical protein